MNMNINVVLNGKQRSFKPSSTFNDLFDDCSLKGKFSDYDFKVKGTLEPEIKTRTKLSQFLNAPQNTVDIVKKVSFIARENPAPPQFISNPIPFSPANNIPCAQGFGPIYNPPNPQPVPGNLPPFANLAPKQPSAELPKPDIVPQPAVLPQPAITVRKNFKRLPDIQEIENHIKDYIIKIYDNGMKVQLRHKNEEEFSATFKEEDAKEERIQDINKLLTAESVIRDNAAVTKVQVGESKEETTKVIFLTGYKGIAIQWATGLRTYFEFEIEY